MLRVILFTSFLNSNFLMADSSVSKYTVKEGDCLYRIAEKYYNNGEKWRLIYGANSDMIKNPDLIYPNMTLFIPLMDENKMTKEKEMNNNSGYDSDSISLDMADRTSTEKKITFEESKNDNKDDSGKDFMTHMNKSDDDDLSEELPLTQASFNISEDRIEVEKNFFDGKVVSGFDKSVESNLFVKGDTIKISLNKKNIQSEINLIKIYMLVHKKKNYYITEKVAECSNCIMSGKDLICTITDLSHPVEKGYPVKIWK